MSNQPAQKRHLVAPANRARQDDLEFHFRAIQRLIGEETIETMLPVSRVTQDDIKNIVAKYGVDNRLRTYLLGMFGLKV